MGLYNTYGTKLHMQMKIGSCLEMKHFDVHDEVDLEDGVYLGYEGAIVVDNGRIIAEYEFVISKWGFKIEPKIIIDQLNPIRKALEEYEKCKGNKG